MVKEDSKTKLYSTTELCWIIQDVLEKKYKVKISSIEFAFDRFIFTVQTSSCDEDVTIPSFWEPIRVGKDSVSFRMTLEDFESYISNIGRRDFKEVFLKSFNMIYGDVFDVISFDVPEHPTSEDIMELIVRIKPNCKFVNHSFLPISWVEGDVFAIEADEIVLGDMFDYIDSGEMGK